MHNDSHKTESAIAPTERPETTQLPFRNRETSSCHLARCRLTFMHAGISYRISPRQKMVLAENSHLHYPEQHGGSGNVANSTIRFAGTLNFTSFRVADSGCQ